MNGTEIPLGMDPRYTLVAGSLVISNPQSARDTGSYQCLAINRCGTIISRAANIKFGCECDEGANCSGDKSSFTATRGSCSELATIRASPVLCADLQTLCFSCRVLFPQIWMISLRTAGVLRLLTKERELSWPASLLRITQVGGTPLRLPHLIKTENR